MTCLENDNNKGCSRGIYHQVTSVTETLNNTEFETSQRSANKILKMNIGEVHLLTYKTEIIN